MPLKATSRRIPDTYLKLVKRFPLIHIRDERHLHDALELLNELLKHDQDPGIQEYLNVLTDLIAAYEDEHVPIADVSEADVLRELMRSNGLSQTALTKAVGIAQSTISAVLTGSLAHQGPDPQARRVLWNRASRLPAARSSSRPKESCISSMNAREIAWSQ